MWTSGYAARKMKSQAREMRAVWAVRSAAPAITYQPETD